MENLKMRLSNLISSMDYRSMRARLTNYNFTIISNNCWSGRVYQDLGLPYTSPFVGLFLFSPCYIKLLEDLERFLNIDLTFIEKSKYEIANKQRFNNNHYYPIGLLSKDIEVHFLHYKSSEEAFRKWNNRVNRIHWDNIYIGYSDRDLFEEKFLILYDQIKYSHKVFFSAKKIPKPYLVWAKEYADKDCVGDTLLINYRKYFDVVDWLNGGNGNLIFPHNLVNRLLVRLATRIR